MSQDSHLRVDVPSCRREEIQEILQLMEEGRVMESAISESDMENVSDRAFYRQSLHLFRQPS